MTGVWLTRVRWSGAALAALVAAAVFVSLAQWVKAAAHPLPFWDQWTFLTSYARMRDGTAESGWFRFLFSQHNEHRIFFSRVLLIADLEFFRGRNQSLLVENFLLQFLSWIGLCRLAWRGVKEKTAQVALAAQAAIVLFSAVQAENFLSGFQVAFFGVYTAAIWGCVACSENRVWRAGIPAALATFTMANGAFLWPVLALLAWVQRRKARWVAGYVGAFFLFFGLFLLGYKHYGFSPLGYVVVRPIQYLDYLVIYLGGFAALQNILAARIIGAGMLLAFFALFTFAWKYRENQDASFWAFLGIAAFVLISAAVTTAGRLRYGADQALTGRYATPSGILFVALAFAWLRRRSELAAEGRPTTRSLDVVLGACILTGVALVLIGHFQHRNEIDDRIRGLNVASDALAVGVIDRRAYSGTFSEPELVKEGTDWLRKKRLSIFAKRPWSMLGSTIGVDIPLAARDRCVGFIDGVNPLDQELPNSPVRFSGWALDTQSGFRPAHIVLADANGLVTGFASESIERLDVDLLHAVPAGRGLGWAGYGLNNVPLTAYGLVDGMKKACKIAVK